jgi:predicted dehydrogenase
MAEQLRVAVAGCGILGTNHVRFFQRNPHTTVVAVADPLAERAEALAATFAGRHYGDAATMFAMEHPDLAVIATPDPFHRDPLVAAADAGVPNLLTEKPMATTLADAEAMAAAARRNGCRLWVHLPSRTAPQEVAARYVYQQGLVGEPIYGDLTIDDNIAVPTQMWGQRSKAWAAGSSTAHFLFSHVVDRMRWLFAPAEVSSVRALVVRRLLGYSPDLYDAHLTWTNGLVLRIKAEWIRYMEPLVDHRFTFSGSTGGWVTTGDAFQTEAGWQATLDQQIDASELERHQQELRAMGVIARAVIRRPHADVEGQGPRPCLEVNRKFLPLFGGDPELEMRDHIVNAIREGVEIPSSWKGGGRLPTGEDGLEQVKIVTAIVRAAESGEEIPLREDQIGERQTGAGQ